MRWWWLWYRAVESAWRHGPEIQIPIVGAARGNEAWPRGPRGEPVTWPYLGKGVYIYADDLIALGEAVPPGFAEACREAPP